MKHRKAEEALRDAALFPEQNPFPILRVARDGTLLYANKSSAYLLDLWGSRQGAQRVPDEVRQHVARALEAEVIARFEAVCGSIIFSFVVAPIAQLGYANLYGRDITERKEAEQALHQAKRDWERTFDSVPDLIVILNNQHVIVRANRAMALKLRTSPEQCVGLNCFKCVHGLSQPPEFCPHTRTLQDGQEHVAEVHEPRLGGDFLVSTTPLMNEQGQMIGSVHVARDITGRKRIEQALRESEIDLNRAQAVAKTGSWRLDVRRNELLWSDETYRMFGIPKGTPLTYETFLGTVHPDDREFVDQKWKAALRGEPYEIEHRIIVNGEVKWVSEKAELEFDKNGALLGGFGTVQEITEHKEMQAKLEEYSKHLEKLVEERTRQLKDVERLAAIGQTAGMVGHDIRNPLQSIIGDVYLAKKDLASLPDSEEKENLLESLEAIGKQSEYINKIVLDLQDFAKPLNPLAEETDLERLVSELLLRNGVPENVQIDAEVDADARKVIADSAYMKRILGNLVSNAVQAMPKGGKLNIRTYREAGDIVISVEDTGVGIPDEAKPKLFQPLFTTKAKGQGFGLAVVKRLTEALNGTITFESQEGKGTKFVMRFPFASRCRQQS